MIDKSLKNWAIELDLHVYKNLIELFKLQNIAET